MIESDVEKFNGDEKALMRSESGWLAGLATHRCSSVRILRHVSSTMQVSCPSRQGQFGDFERSIVSMARQVSGEGDHQYSRSPQSTGT